VADLAVLGSGNGFDVVRPFPPRLERGHADVTATQVNQVNVPVSSERANLIGSIEPLRFRLTHLSLLPPASADSALIIVLQYGRVPEDEDDEF
jgi:hypothetical protein